MICSKFVVELLVDVCVESYLAKKMLLRSHFPTMNHEISLRIFHIINVVLHCSNGNPPTPLARCTRNSLSSYCTHKQHESHETSISGECLSQHYESANTITSNRVGDFYVTESQFNRTLDGKTLIVSARGVHEHIMQR